jgi:hypothetical protein
MDNKEFKEIAEEFAGLGLTLPEDTFESTRPYMKAWISLSMVDSSKAKPLQKRLQEMFYKEHPDVTPKKPAHEMFSISDYPVGEGKIHEGEELAEGLVRWDRECLDINELLKKKIVQRGNTISLANFPNVHEVVVASQEQLNMLTDEAKAQIDVIVLNNNASMQGGDYYVQNEKPMETTLDLRAYKNLKTVKSFDYVNNDLRDIKLPEATKYAFFHCSSMPKLDASKLSAESWCDKVMTQQGERDDTGASIDFDYPKNQQEAEALFDQMDALGDWVCPNGMRIVDDENRGVLDIVKEYPDLAPKAASAIYACGFANLGQNQSADISSYDLYKMFDIPTADGKTVIEAHPELACSYYNILQDEYDTEFSNLVGTARKFPNVLGMLKERVESDLKEGGTPDLDTLAVIGAADPSCTEKVCQILKSKESGWNREHHFLDMAPYHKTAAAEYLKALSKAKPGDQEALDEITYQASYVVQQWPELAGFAYKSLKQAAKRGTKRNEGKTLEVDERVFDTAGNGNNTQLAKKQQDGDVGFKRYKAKLNTQSPKEQKSKHQRPTNLAEQRKINNTKLLRESKGMSR